MDFVTKICIKLIGFIYYLNISYAGNILVHLPTYGRSHFKPFQPLFIELAKRGHHVKIIGTFPPEHIIENYTHISIKPKNKFPGPNFSVDRDENRLRNYINLHYTMHKYSIELLEEPASIQLLNSKEKFDLVLMECYHLDSFFALSKLFNAPIIGLSFQPLLPIYNWHIKNPWTFSYVSNLYLPFSDQMNFVQRLFNTLFGIFNVLFYNFISKPLYSKHIDMLMKPLNKKGIPRIEEVTEKLSLILVETHFSVGYAKPNLPNVVEVAGIHLPQPKKLPEDIEQFINGSEEGVLYVSFGTLVNPDSVNHISLKFLKIFEKLPSNVIWKWNPKLLPYIPKNVLVKEWLPQTDILDHPNCRLFISHGGYHSLVETVNAGVPILCLPFFTDQYYNAAIVYKYSFGRMAKLEDSEEELLDVIRDLLIDKKYQKNAEYRSKIFKDRPISPLNLAVYWTEYIMKYGGASNLKSKGAELHWFQYLLLDVISFILVVSVIICYLVNRCIIKSVRLLLFKTKTD